MKALLLNPVSKNLFLTLFAMMAVLACILIFQSFSGPVSQHFETRSASNSHYQEAYGYDEEPTTDGSTLPSK